MSVKANDFWRLSPGEGLEQNYVAPSMFVCHLQCMEVLCGSITGSGNEGLNEDEGEW